jgi:two-component system C4-dicarboxylate transport response regulator DctD
MNESLKVLVVEDDPNVRLGCQQALQLADIAVDCAASAEQALTSVGRDFPGVVVTDMRLPGMDGLQLLRRLTEADPNLPVIMITGHGDVTLAVEVMRAGAYDFIQKPFAPELLVEVVGRALEKRALTLEVEALRRRLDHRDDLEGRLIGRSPQMAAVRRLVLDVADAAVDVLILGETGTGKEMVARCLHDLSRRRAEQFVALNCGGLPDNLLDSELFGHEAGAFTGAQKRRIGKFEHANGGTLFLDELESMSVPMQVKLLRVLQERNIERLGSNQLIPVSCRVVAATKENLKEASDQQKFRADLYYRLNVVTIDLPPLRERREDIPALYEHFLKLSAKQHDRPLPELRIERLHELMAHDWPGNVRELRNVADCHVLGIRKEFVGAAPTPRAEGLSLADAVDNFERSLIAAELARQAGNLTKAAEALRVAKTTLHDKVKKHGLKATS